MDQQYHRSGQKPDAPAEPVARVRDAGEAKLRAFLEAAAQGILAIDADSRIVLVNAKLEEQFGYSRDELLGRPLDTLIPERFRQRHAGHVAGFFRSPKQRPMGVGLEFTGLRKDGTEFPVEISLNYYEDGENRLGMAFITDITARKRIAEQLRETAKLESLGVLAGGIAHDFNNLLVGVIGNAGLALEAVPPGSPVRTRLEAIQQAGERAADLVRQLLAYSGKGRFVIEPVNISDLIRETVRLIEASVQNAVLVLDLQANASIQADASQIQQLIMNLVINAAEAIGESDGTVTVRTRERDIAGGPEASRAEAPKPGRYVEIVVEDTGAGMDEPTRERIFDPFFTTKFTGRGLGLAAALGIVRGHKGHIDVESEPGRGSRFSVLFPVSIEREPEPAPEPEDLQGSGTVLVVDDEEVVRSSAAMALQRYGYDAITAENGRKAIEMVRRDGSIVAVVLDLTMPMMSGEEALRRLRELRPDIPIVLSSGYSAEEAVKRFRSHGLAAFLQKPYTAGRLAAAIKAARAQAAAGSTQSG